MKNLKLNKLSNLGKFLTNIKRNYNQSYPKISVKVDKETQQVIPPESEIKTKKPEDVKYSSKFEINPDNLPDYDIIGAEIFKNAFKDSVLQYQNVDRDLQALTKEEIEKELYQPEVKPLAWQEPNKYYKHFTRRSFYDNAQPKFRHMFVPSWRYKVEPFNSTHVFKWGYIEGDRKAHNETLFKRNSYVPGFSPPFNLNHPEVEKIISQLSELQKKNNFEYNSPEFQKIVNDPYKKPENSENEGIKIYTQIIDNFYNLIPSFPYKQIPNLLMRLFYDLSLNSKKLWISFEQEILNNLHHYTINEICQINYISSVTSPKYTSDNFRLLLAQTVIRQLEGNNMSLEELHAVALGFRYTKKRYIYDKIAENLIRRKHNFIEEGVSSKNSDTPSNLAKIFYSWSVNKPKNDTTLTYYPQKELTENLIQTYEDALINNIIKMTPEDLSRLATSLYLMKTDSVDPFINRIERNLLKLKSTSPEKIDSFSLHSILRAFSKMKENKMVGSDKFFDEMESIVINHIDNFNLSFQQMTDILYAYSVRGSGSQKLYDLFNRKINEDIEKANSYHCLHNIAWHYLFTENKNLEQWSALFKQFNKIPERLPVYYYRPFKISAYFLDHAFSEHDIVSKIGDENYIDFKDRFYDPEQIYDYVKYEKLFDKYPEYSSFKAILNGRLIIFPVSHLVLENMFMVHNSWEHKKMGINVWLERDLVPKTNRLNKHCLVHSNMLKLAGWEILDVNWVDFMDLGGQVERDKFIHNWYHSTCKKQEEKGIYKMNVKFV